MPTTGLAPPPTSHIDIATARCVAKLGIDLAVDFAVEAVALDAASKVLGIYVYQRPDGKYYVGQSVDIRRRMAEHGDKVKRIVAVLQVTTKNSSAANYLNNLEQALISALGGLNTKANKNSGGIPKNLREQLRSGDPKRLCLLFEAKDGQLYWIEVEIDWRTEPADGTKPDRLNRDVGALG